MPEAPTHATILLTGGSRGVGAATVLALAARGATILFTYREKAARAEAVAAEAGGRAIPIQADLTAPADLDRLVATARATTPALTGLVLNASGGLEKDRLAVDPDFALHLNRDAQLALLDRALPLLARGGAVVFVTSHWAHFYGRQPAPESYAGVARAKHAGEQALRARQPELAARNLRLLVVSGDVIEGTITPRLLERAEPGLLAARRARVSALPTADDMAAAVVTALTDADLASGHTLYVGSTLP